MRRYAKLSSIDKKLFIDILKFFFDKCDKVNIYFPNTTKNAQAKEINTFKTNFLAATHIIENPEELGNLEESLEEKDGFSMIIASLTEEVKELIIQMKSNLSLNLGLIQGDKVLFYLGDEDECVVEADEDSDIFKSTLFDTFKTI
ncbi:hypothetical protein QTL86_18120 [Cellulosilyticum sp. ST5]|uniref:Uncharacterized protein n=1 Tax=Cellulosilyticum lentocellum (strain ATCC 49066 / DSM 5427 / NCIMB 11756 / RHM5) TaxID=642492 RepID=F2JSK3_CELLD|nr:MULTISPECIES: hypothetical protein [Cellulosilyticum]ADZ81783.1 hypothetical protein Clole_0021 [Cellulosilyticum lentocellum DSM 5427]QEH67451.1 hypothetical protein EKH84_03025 [Cellulosilyticum sp. WCF-2]